MDGALFVTFITAVFFGGATMFAWWDLRITEYLILNYPKIWIEITTLSIFGTTTRGNNGFRFLKTLIRPPQQLGNDNNFQRLRKFYIWTVCIWLMLPMIAFGFAMILGLQPPRFILEDHWIIRSLPVLALGIVLVLFIRVVYSVLKLGNDHYLLPQFLEEKELNRLRTDPKLRGLWQRFIRALFSLIIGGFALFSIFSILALFTID